MKKDVMLYQDYVPVDKSLFSIAAVHDCGIDVVNYTPYPPNLSIICFPT